MTMSILNIEIIAVGKLKSKHPLSSAYDEYTRRLQGKCTLYELEGRDQKQEHDKIIEKLNPNTALVILDERGKSLPSQEFAKKLETLQQIKPGTIQFVLGGADGLSDEIRTRADLLMSFGAQTWPHMMARVMLVEQIYRAQQILANHPYHRE